MTTAQLGFTVDSGNMPKAIADLDKLVAAAGTTEAATARMAAAATASLGKLGGAAGGAAAQLGKTAVEVETFAQRIDRALNFRTGNTVGTAFARDVFRADDIKAYGMELDRVRAKYNPLFAIAMQYRNVVGEIRQANAVGAISHIEMAAAIERERVATQALVVAQRQQRGGGGAGPRPPGAPPPDNRGMTGALSSNLMYQFQDIAVTSAMGMNPAMIALQQGAQIGGAMTAMGGGVSSVQALGGALAMLISPTNLIAIGLTAAAAAAIQFWSSSESKADKARDQLKDYYATVDKVRKSYGEAGGAADTFGRKSVLAAESAERLLRAKLQLTATDQRKVLEGSLGSSLGIVPEALQLGDVNLVFAPFREAIADLRAELKAGNPDFDKFAERIKDVSATDPSRLQQWGDQLMRMISEAADTQAALDGVLGGLRDMSHIDPSTVRAQQQITSLGDAAERTTTRFRDLIVEGGNFARMLAGMDALYRTVAPKGDAIGGKGSLDRASDEFDAQLKLWRRFGDDGSGGFDPDKSKKVASSKSDPYRDLIKSANDRLAQMRLEIQLSGQVGAAAASLRYETELLNQATDRGRKLTGAQREEIAKLADSYGELTVRAAQAKMQQDLLFERSQMFRSPLDQAIASKQHGAGLEVDLNSTEAGIIRVNTAMQQASQIGGEFFGGLVTGISNGANGVDVLVSSLDRLLDKMIEMAANELWTSLFGAAAGALGLGGGLAGGSGWEGLRSVTGTRAGGGSVVAGRRYLVGERRAEIFEPNQNGVIHPSTAGGGAGGGGGGGHTFVYSPRANVSNGEGGMSRTELEAFFRRDQRDFVRKVNSALIQIKTEGWQN